MLCEHDAVHSPFKACPIGWLTAGQRAQHFDALYFRRDRLELRSVNEVIVRTRRAQVPHRDVVASPDAGPQHRHQRDHSAATSDELKRPTPRWLPNEIAAHRTSDLDPITDSQVFNEKWGDLPFIDQFDGDDNLLIVGRPGDRVAALRLITVFGSQSYVDVVPGEMTRPAGTFEDDASHSFRLFDDLRCSGDQPVQSPW